MTPRESIQEIYGQIKIVLNCLTDGQYVLNLDAFNGSTIGMHVRHIVDFYLCIYGGINATTIDYNCRERNPLIETSIQAALSSFNQLTESFVNVSDDKLINVLTDFSADDSTSRSQVLSSIGRELMYAFDHAIHHLAIIKMGIRSSFPSVTLDQNIGVAPSTIKFNSQN